MKDRLLQWIFAITLGVVLPSLIMRMIPKKTGEETDRAQVHPSAQTEMVKMIDAGGSVTEIELEAYVLGVVLAEMPAEFEAEALKAQAVLARTYVKKRVADQSKHANAHVCVDPQCCQGFIDTGAYQGDEESLAKVTEAVDATEGKVLTYEGALIDATYFSCSGGRTEDATAVWGTDVPYLQATDSPGEESASQYLSTVVLEQQECLSKLGLEGKTLQIGEMSYTDGGGVDTMDICGKKFTGVQIRQMLALKSTMFRINSVGNNVVITVKGYGHRVGMSQYGADAMAAQGYTYDQILAHYYTGTELVSNFY